MATESKATETDVMIPDLEFKSKIIEAGASTLNLCFMCGTCTGSCPSGKFTAFRTRKLIRLAQLGQKDRILPSDDMWFCTTCYTCHERCPRGVEIPEIIYTLRNLAVQAGYMAEAHKKVAGILLNTGHMVKINDEIKAKRKTLGLPEIPPTVLSDPDALKGLQAILAATGFDKLIGDGK